MQRKGRRQEGRKIRGRRERAVLRSVSRPGHGVPSSLREGGQVSRSTPPPRRGLMQSGLESTAGHCVLQGPRREGEGSVLQAASNTSHSHEFKLPGSHVNKVRKKQVTFMLTQYVKLLPFYRKRDALCFVSDTVSGVMLTQHVGHGCCPTVRPGMRTRPVPLWPRTLQISLTPPQASYERGLTVCSVLCSLAVLVHKPSGFKQRCAPGGLRWQAWMSRPRETDNKPKGAAYHHHHSGSDGTL